MHYWGDGFDFDRLEEAGRKIAKIYKILSGNDIIWKEKYGTLRFEFQQAWIKTSEDYENFVTSVVLVVCRYPDLASEILSDFTFLPSSSYNEIEKVLKDEQ